MDHAAPSARAEPDPDAVAARLVGAIVTELDAHRDPERAAAQARYLKSSLRHLGVVVPEVRRTVRGALRSARDAGAVLAPAVRAAAVRRLWAEPVHEHRLAAVELLVAERARLDPVADLPLIEELLRGCRTWALLDPLAASVAGPCLDALDALGADGRRGADGRGGGDGTAVLERWIADADFWMRRAALLAHLEALRRGGGDFERFGRLADRVLDEREFFVRKAIGWVLRDTGRRRPELVAAWARPRWARMSGVTRREVAKVLDTTTF